MTAQDAGLRDQRSTPVARLEDEAPSATMGHSRWWGVATCMAPAGAFGAFAGVWTPRGPLDTTSALVTLAVAFVVGLVAGAAMRSRWAMLLAPVTFVAVFEVVRIDATGPTVDAIDPTTLATLAASVALRVVHGLLALVPMALGAAYGRAWAAHRTPGHPPPASRLATVARTGRRLTAAAIAAALLVLAVMIARPASTASVVGPGGEPMPDGITELTTVTLGGHDQRVLIRGSDVDDPVLLFLAGGPGGAELGTMRRYGDLLERDFVVVSWDQRGTGASYRSIDPATTLTFEQAVADTIELSAWLRDRFSTDRIHLVGNSYGTLLGTLAAQRRPDLYASVVGAGQMVDVAETDQIFYDDTLAHAARTGDDALAATLRDLGRPPYDDPLLMLPITMAEQDWNDYTDVAGHQGKREFVENLGVSEYTLLDRVGALAGLVDAYAIIYPQLQDLDLRARVPRLDVATYLVEGRYEAPGRLEPVEAWFAALDAPDKRLVTFDLSGHRPFVEEPERFHELMTRIADDNPAADAR